MIIDFTNEDLFEQKPRFKDCPPICHAANLPTFLTEKAAKAWHDRIGGDRCAITRIGQCRVCGGWHYKSMAPDPAGGSSGNTRHQKHKD